MRESSRIVFEQQRIERFGFDPEILFLAKRHGLRTAEVAVRWAHDPATKVHMFRDSLMMFFDLAHHPLELASGPLSQSEAGRN